MTMERSKFPLPIHTQNASAESSGERERFIASLTKFYRLLTQLPYVPSEALMEPPSGGWLDVDHEALHKRGKTDAAIEVLRHLPYLDTDVENGNQRWTLAFHTLHVNYARRRTNPAFLDDILPTPGHVVWLSDGWERAGYYWLLNTETFEIVEWELMGETCMLDHDTEESIPVNERWCKAYPTLPGAEYFDLLRCKYETLETIIVRTPYAFFGTGEEFFRDPALVWLDGLVDSDDEDGDYAPSESDSDESLSEDEIYTEDPDELRQEIAALSPPASPRSMPAVLLLQGGGLNDDSDTHEEAEPGAQAAIEDDWVDLGAAHVNTMLPQEESESHTDDDAPDVHSHLVALTPLTPDDSATIKRWRRTARKSHLFQLDIRMSPDHHWLKNERPWDVTRRREVKEVTAILTKHGWPVSFPPKTVAHRRYVPHPSANGPDLSRFDREACRIELDAWSEARERQHKEDYHESRRQQRRVKRAKRDERNRKRKAGEKIEETYRDQEDLSSTDEETEALVERMPDGRKLTGGVPPRKKT